MEVLPICIKYIAPTQSEGKIIVTILSGALRTEQISQVAIAQEPTNKRLEFIISIFSFLKDNVYNEYFVQD